MSLAINKNNYVKLFNKKVNKYSAIASWEFLSIIRGLSFFNLIPNNKPILEVGPGIGTITKVLLKNYLNDIYCYELDNFCYDQLIKIKKQDFRNSKKRMHISANVSDFYKLNFGTIIIDGPINKQQLLNVIFGSKDLQLVIIENYRLLQRVRVAKVLKKGKFRQQFVEILINDRPICSIFFVNKKFHPEKYHIIFDYVLVLLRLLPKLILHIYLSKGALLLSDKNLERRFERKVPKTKF